MPSLPDLAGLLARVFTDSELRVFVEQEGLGAELPGSGVSRAALCLGAAQELSAKERLNAAFFQSLAERSGGEFPALVQVAAGFGVHGLAPPRSGGARLRPLVRALEALGPLSGEELALLRARGGDWPTDAHAADWTRFVSACGPAARARLVQRLWPRPELPDEALQARLVASIGASSLSRAGLLGLAQAVGLARALPSEEHADAWILELVDRAQREGSAMERLFRRLLSALPDEEVEAFGIEALNERWSARRWAEREAQEAALRGRCEALAEALRVAKPEDIAGLLAPKRVVVEQSPAQARELGDLLDEAETLHRRFNPLARLRAAALLLYAGRLPMTAEQAGDARRLGGRLGPLLGRMVGRGLVPKLLLWLLTSGAPLELTGPLSAAALAWLLRWLYPAAALIAAVVGGVGVKLVAEVEPTALTTDEEAERAKETLGPLMDDLKRGGWASDQSARRAQWLDLDAAMRWMGGEEPAVVAAPPATPKPVKSRPPPKTEPAAEESKDPAGEDGEADEAGEAEQQAPPPPPPGASTDPNAGIGPNTATGALIAANAGPCVVAATGGPSGRTWTARSAKMSFIGLTAGRYCMGSPDGEGVDDEHPQHEERVAAFLIGQSEVTVRQWRAVVERGQARGDSEAQGLNPVPSKVKGGDRPVEQVSWCAAARFANVLSRLEGLRPYYTVNADCEAVGTVVWDRKANGFRLPSEVEWEYAARAGTTTRYATGDTEADLARVGWTDGDVTIATHEVCTAPEKPWGLCDMHGNMWEWTGDWYAAYGAPKSADSAGGFRVVRGGSWVGLAEVARSANRYGYRPELLGGYIGFRLVLPAVPPKRP